MSNIVKRNIKKGSVTILNTSLESGSQNLYEKLMNIDNPEKILNQYLESNTIKDIDISSIINFYNMLSEPDKERKDQEEREAVKITEYENLPPGVKAYREQEAARKTKTAREPDKERKDQEEREAVKITENENLPPGVKAYREQEAREAAQTAGKRRSSRKKSKRRRSRRRSRH